jgi:trk system potassium uptake protein TrkA
MHIVIIGGNAVGQTLAAQLDTTYNEVLFIDEDEHVIECADESGLATTAIDDIRESASTDILDVDLSTIIVVASARDSANLLIAQLIRNRFDVGRLIVRVNDPQNHSVFADLGLDAVYSTPVLAAALVDAVRTIPELNRDQEVTQEEWV